MIFGYGERHDEVCATPRAVDLAMHCGWMRTTEGTQLSAGRKCPIQVWREVSQSPRAGKFSAAGDWQSSARDRRLGPRWHRLQTQRLPRQGGPARFLGLLVTVLSGNDPL